MPSIFEIFGVVRPVTLHKNAGELLLRIDATTKEEHSLKAKATKHEVEDGSSLSDHILQGGVGLVLEGIVSDNPITMEMAAISTAAGVVGGVMSNESLGALVTGAGAYFGGLLMEDSKKPSLTAYSVLRDMYEQKQLFTVVTGLNIYTDMVMEQLTVTRNSRKSNALHFVARFAKISYAQTMIVDVPHEATEEGNTAITDLGTQAVNEASEKVSEKAGSWWLQLLQWSGIVQ